MDNQTNSQFTVAAEPQAGVKRKALPCYLFPNTLQPPFGQGVPEWRPSWPMCFVKCCCIAAKLRSPQASSSQQRASSAKQTQSFPPPALSQRRHRGLARLSIAVRWYAIFGVPEGERPHPRRSYGRRIGFEDAADHFAIGQHVVIVVIPFAGRARGGARLSVR